MPIYDKDGNLSSAAYALDTHAALNDEPSLLDSASNFVTKGIPLTGLSIVNSFANTAIDVGNFFGADVKRLTVEDEVGDGDLNDYYKKHAEGIETAGLIVGSLIPGLGAIKGASAAVKATWLAKGGYSTEALAGATGILAPLKARVIEDGLQTINSGTSALFGALNLQKTQAIALGFGDQAIQGAIFSAATAATMHASPLLDQQTLSDTVQDVFYGAVAGGFIGGILEGIGTRALFNRSLMKADNASKAQEVSTRLGLGNYVAGDRVASLLDSLESIPPAESSMASGKLKLTRDSAILEAKKVLQTLVPKGDEEVTNGLFDVIMKMRDENGVLDKESMYQYLGRLAKVSRYTGDDAGSITTGDTFYINQFATDKKGDWNSLVTNIPHEDAEASLRYQMKPGASDVNIARASTEFVTPSGESIPLFSSQKDAWENGHDIFIDKNLKIHINPDSENISRVAREGEGRVLTIAEEMERAASGNLPPESKPLYGAPLILNTKTGAVSTSATPVVGDFGKVSLSDRGLQYGEKFSAQSLHKGLTAQTETIDANARYVWAAKRGLKAGDTIDITDVPMMEALYAAATKEPGKFAETMASFEKRGISLTTDTSLSSFAEKDLLATIQQEKNNLINEVIQHDPDLSSADVALRANVPESYVNSGMKSTSKADFMVNTADHATSTHVKLEYDIGSTSQVDGQILRGALDTQYRVGLIRQANRDAAANFFGKDYEQFLSEASASEANIFGTGNKFLSFSNSDYGSLGQKMERIGRMTTKFITQKNAEWAEVLAPHINAIRQDEVAAAELGMFRAVRQRTNSSYSFLPPELAAKYEVSPNTAVLTDSLKKDKNGQIIDWNKGYTPDGFFPGAAKADQAEEIIVDQPHSWYVLSPKVADFERAQQSVNDTRIGQRNQWYASQGLNKTIEPGTLYTPPIDTSKYPFFAYVKNKEGMAMSDDGVAVITGRTKEELQGKISNLGDQFSVYTKEDLKKFHQVEGDYLYKRNFSNSQVDNAIQRQGILNDILPETRADNLAERYADWNSKQTISLVRDHIELGNAQLFAELRTMGEKFANTETSQTGFVSGFVKKSVDNPYDTYIKTALGISEKDSQYPVWAWAQEKAESYASTAFNVARNAFVSAKKGILPYEQAANMAKSFGLGNPYEAGIDVLKSYYGIANKLPDVKFLQGFVSKANAVLGATVIRLDMWQQFVDITTSPILMMTEAAAALSGKGNPVLQKALMTELPDGTGRQVPAVSKLMFNAVSNYFNDTIREAWLPVYKDLGIIRDSKVIDSHFEAINNLALPYGKFDQSKVVKGLSDATDFAAKYITGSDLQHSMLRFMSADIGRQVFEALGYEGKELTDNIGTFQNRVFGNYVASQRPVAFQGPVGQAIGLFQTFQFNLFQQLFKYVENGQGKSLAMMAGLQSTFYGAQSLPGFHFINNHLIGNAAGNPGHSDLYTAIPNLLDPVLGNYLMYGVMSNITGAGLYSRGDINPQQLSILPLNPLDFPAIRGGIKFVGSLIDTEEKIRQGGNTSASLLLGLEHNGLSRPLSGLAQLIQGFTTTANGDVVSYNRVGRSEQGMSEMFSIANFSRISGARPIDEAIAMDALFRSAMYKAKDLSRIGDVGQAVRTTLYNGGTPTADQVQDFAKEYAGAGGRIENFGAAMTKWTQAASASVANKVFMSLKTDGSSKNMMQIMGGQPLPDYLNTPKTFADASAPP